MSICRTHRKKNNFSILDNEAPNNEKLSYQARGILWYLLTKPDGWQVKMKDIENRSKKNGRDGVRSAFKELMEEGYALRDRYHDETGKICWETHVFETKADRDEWLIENNLTIDAFPATVNHLRLADDGEPTHGEPGDGKASYIVNNDSSNTDKENTEEVTKLECVKKEDTKKEPPLDSTLNTPTCPGPAAKSKSLRVLLEEMVEIYNTHKVDWWASMRELGTRDAPFTKMVKTYGEDRILDMWRESLEAAKLDNWWGVQLDPKTGEKKKLSVTNFLSNSNWYNIREKHLDSLNTNVETSSLESIRQQILAILSELNMTAALPQQVRDATGCRILSELDQSQCVRYLNMLKRIKEKKQNQEGTAA